MNPGQRQEAGIAYSPLRSTTGTRPISTSRMVPPPTAVTAPSANTRPDPAPGTTRDAVPTGPMSTRWVLRCAYRRAEPSRRGGRGVGGAASVGSMLTEFGADLGKHLGSKQFDAVQDVVVRHAADIHLQ